MAGRPVPVRDVLRFHRSLLRGFFGIVLAAENLRQTISGLLLPVLAGANWLLSKGPKPSAMLSPLQTNVLYALGAISLVVYVAWALMKANYLKYLEMRDDRDQWRAEVLRIDMAQQAADAETTAKESAERPFRVIYNAAEDAIKEIAKLLDEERRAQLSTTLRGIMGWSDEKRAEIYFRDIAPLVSAVMASLKDKNMSDPALEGLYIKGQSDVISLKAMTASLKGLQARVKPLTGWSWSD
jgi:antitoxin (DNA-binding transcriptional repressor) of toxin-antitoxin stability system